MFVCFLCRYLSYSMKLLKIMKEKLRMDEMCEGYVTNLFWMA
jgi:hypothetical protein